jgi:hypothetical protein
MLLTCSRTLYLAVLPSQLHQESPARKQPCGVRVLRTCQPSQINSGYFDCLQLLWRITSVATERNSAPVVLGQSLAMRSKRMSLSTFILSLKLDDALRLAHNTNLLACMRSICALPSVSGKENSTRRSRRPGLSSAGSSVSGLRYSPVERTFWILLDALTGL